MKVHVICHGLFGVVIPKDESFVEAVFLDAAGWKDKNNPIPNHELFIRYSTPGGTMAATRLSKRGVLQLEGLPGDAVVVDSRPTSMSEVLGKNVRLRRECEPGQLGQCDLNDSPLVRTRLRLTGGRLRNCEFDLANGIDFGESDNGWGHQHLDYAWQPSGGPVRKVQKTFNAVVFTFETEEPVRLQIGGERVTLGKMAHFDQRLGQLGKDFALLVLNNTVPKDALTAGHFHIDPNRDTHSLLFHDLLQDPLPIDQRPIPTLVTPLETFREASPLNRCIPIST